jgi:hypothetical protein
MRNGQDVSANHEKLKVDPQMREEKTVSNKAKSHDNTPRSLEYQQNRYIRLDAKIISKHHLHNYFRKDNKVHHRYPLNYWYFRKGKIRAMVLHKHL